MGEPETQLEPGKPLSSDKRQGQDTGKWDREGWGLGQKGSPQAQLEAHLIRFSSYCLWALQVKWRHLAESRRDPANPASAITALTLAGGFRQKGVPPTPPSLPVPRDISSTSNFLSLPSTLALDVHLCFHGPCVHTGTHPMQVLPAWPLPWPGALPQAVGGRVGRLAAQGLPAPLLPGDNLFSAIVGVVQGLGFRLGRAGEEPEACRLG